MVIVDTAPFDAAAVDLKWESHVNMWSTAVERIRRNPRPLTCAAAESLLDAVCREQRIVLDTVDLRQRLIQLLSRRVAPTCTVIQLAEHLARRGITMQIYGSGWTAVERAVQCYAGPAPGPEERNEAYNATRVFVSVDRGLEDTSRILEALAAGACVAIPTPLLNDSASVHAELLTVLPQFETPAHGADLVSTILLADEDHCAQAREIVREKHLMRHRLASLMQFCA